MHLRTLFAGLTLLCISAHGTAFAAQKKAENASWIGTWGYVSVPAAPGAAPPAPPGPFGTPPATPLGAVPAPPPAAPAGTLPPPLLDNPGKVRIDTAPADLSNVTVRQVARVSVGGNRLRLRFSNEGGVDSLVFAAVHVAQAGADGATVAGTDHPVTFSGQTGVVIPPGAPLLSDPVDLPTQSLEKLYVSIYLAGPVASRATRSAFQYVAGTAGDFTGTQNLPEVRLMRVPVFLTLVEVQPAKPTNVLVTLGDSITEGAASTANAFRSWPDQLPSCWRIAVGPWSTRALAATGSFAMARGPTPSPAWIATC